MCCAVSAKPESFKCVSPWFARGSKARRGATSFICPVDPGVLLLNSVCTGVGGGRPVHGRQVIGVGRCCKCFLVQLATAVANCTASTAKGGIVAWI